jgi:hypothetical protein
MVSRATLQMSPSVRMLGLPPDVIIVLPSEMATGFVAAVGGERLLVKAAISWFGIFTSSLHTVLH